VGRIVWKLKETMEEFGLKPLDLEREAIRAGLPVGKNVMYRVATADGPQRIDRSTLAAVVVALRRLTGAAIGIDAVMMYSDGPELLASEDGRQAEH
jgi:hypothetical protein